jgi:hypothetical protein
MKTLLNRILDLFMLAGLLCACEQKATPLPTNTPVPPTAAHTITSTPLPPTPTPAQTLILPKPSSTPKPTQIYVSANTVAVSPTPVPGWRTYTNEYLGYGFNYPKGGSIYERGPDGMDVNEVVPFGFTFDEYFDYVMAILPDSLCVSVEIPGALITIAPPYKPIGSYVSPCPGMGIGADYRMESATETWTIAGRQYKDSQGTKLYLKSTGVFYGEFYIFDLENGFRITFNGMPRGEMSSERYQAQRDAARGILATLHWFRVPDLTKPGTTCAGKFTRLVPGEEAVVTGTPTDPPNRVRLGPSLSDEIISQIYPQTHVKVIEGPVCTDGLVFWKVENSMIPGGSGWTVEGDGTEHWLEPYKP